MKNKNNYENDNSYNNNNKYDEKINEIFDKRKINYNKIK